jgi:hypothetical protein
MSESTHLNWKFPKYHLEWLEKRTILLTLGGSRAYGTDTHESDIDVRGICVPPASYYHGFTSKFEQAEIRDGSDVVVYEIKKFFSLAAKCNPNILEILYSDPSHHILVHPLGRTLLDNRDLFLSKQAAASFAGYAHAQIHRIKELEFDNKEPKALKHGMHLVRLFDMGNEVLRGEGVKVLRPDRALLTAIRGGVWSFEELVEYSEEAVKDLEFAKKNSNLPDSPDYVKLDSLCQTLVESALEE